MPKNSYNSWITSAVSYMVLKLNIFFEHNIIRRTVFIYLANQIYIIYKS